MSDSVIQHPCSLVFNDCLWLLVSRSLDDIEHELPPMDEIKVISPGEDMIDKMYLVVYSIGDAKEYNQEDAAVALGKDMCTITLDFGISTIEVVKWRFLIYHRLL